ncbi:MAG: ester cyclase [Chloroflexia bacterium]
MADDKLENNKKIVRRMLEAFNTGDTKVVEELIAPNIRDVANLHGFEEHERRMPVPQRVQTEIMLGKQAFPDKKFKVESIIAEGDTVILRWSMTGTHTGTLFGRKATGKKVKVSGTEIVRIKDGKIVEHDDDGVHTLQLLQQLGWLDAKMRRKVGIEE